MRLPAGAPMPLWFSIRNKLPKSLRFSQLPLGTIAVVSTVVVTCIGVFAVTIYPMIDNDYYKNAQAEERALLRGTKEDYAQGLRVWSDPFGRK